jgi:hypothetical protein
VLIGGILRRKEKIHAVSPIEQNAKSALMASYPTAVLLVSDPNTFRQVNEIK